MACNLPLRDVPSLSRKEKVLMINTEEILLFKGYVYTVMSYGVKISEVSKNIQERVKFNLENQLGIKAETVNVYVQNIKVVGEN